MGFAVFSLVNTGLEFLALEKAADAGRLIARSDVSGV